MLWLGRAYTVEIAQCLDREGSSSFQKLKKSVKICLNIWCYSFCKSVTLANMRLCVSFKYSPTQFSLSEYKHIDNEASRKIITVQRISNSGPHICQSVGKIYNCSNL